MFLIRKCLFVRHDSFHVVCVGVYPFQQDTLGNIFLESAWNFWPKWSSIVARSFLGWLGDCRSGLGPEAGKMGELKQAERCPDPHPVLAL